MKELNAQLQKQNLIEEETNKEEQLFETGFKREDKYITSEDNATEQFANESAQKLSDSFNEVSKIDGVRELKGEQPGEPKYIGMDKKFTTIVEGDSDRMRMVKEALAILHDENKKVSDVAALNNLIFACDNYCKGRFAFFKAFRKAGVRLAEVKALRQEAIERRDNLIKQNPEENIALNPVTSQKKKDRSKTLHNEESTVKEDLKKYGHDSDDIDDLDDDAILDAGYDNEGKFVETRESLSKAYNASKTDFDKIEALEKELEPLTVIMDRFLEYKKEHEPDSPIIEERKELDEKFLENKQKFQKKVENKTKELRDKIIKSYQIPYYNEKELAGYENDYSLYSGKLLQRYPQSQVIVKMEDHLNDVEQAKAEREKRMVYRKLAEENFESQTVYSETKTDYRDSEYNEEELKKMLEELDKIDLTQISFNDHESMLRDYAASMKTFNRIRTIHNQLFRGLVRGFKPDDQTLLRYRAKMTAAFEMENYLAHLNHAAMNGEINIVSDADATRERIIKNMNKKIMTRHFAKPGDVKGLILECENAVKEEYENREKTIRSVYKAVEKAGSDEPMPEDLLSKKKDAFLANSLMYDFVERRMERYTQNFSGDYIDTYNKKNKTNVDKTGSRLHLSFLYNKTMEEKVRLAKLRDGTPKEQLTYWKEMIRDIKSVDWKEFELRDKGKLYDDYERKDYMLNLTTNAVDIGKGIMAALKELQKDELKKNPKARPKLPEDFKAEFGYKNLDDLLKDMHVTNELGNEIQGKFDTAAQTHNHGFMPYFSFDELYSMESEEQFRIKEDIAKQTETDGDFLFTDVGSWTESFSRQMEFFNIWLGKTRPITEADKKKGKQPKALTNDMDITEVVKEEEKAYIGDQFRLNSNYDSIIAEKQSKEAREFNEKTDNLYHSRNDMVNETEIAIGVNNRLLKTVVGTMNYFYNDSKEKTAERIKALNVTLDKATKKQKQDYAKELENTFALIMNFDLNELNFDNVSDLYSDSHTNAAVMTKFCFDFNALFKEYKKLIDDPDVDTLLDEKEYQEVAAKRAFIMSASNLYSKLPERFGKPEHLTINPIEIVYWTQDMIGEKLSGGKTTGKEQEQYWTLYSNFDAIKESGMAPGVDMEELFKSTRVEMYGAPAEDATEKIKEKLNK